MNVYEDKYLPIGSIVQLNNKPGNIFIMGYLPGNYNTEVYDYIGCTQDNGINPMSVFNKDYFFFNKEDIKKVIFIGYQNINYSIYTSALYQEKKEIEEYKKNHNGEISEDEYLNIIIKTCKEWYSQGGQNEIFITIITT